MRIRVRVTYHLTVGWRPRCKARASGCSFVVDDFDEVRLVRAVLLDP